MSIHFYHDDAGFVGEPGLSPNAAAALDSIGEAHDLIAEASDALVNIGALLDRPASAIAHNPRSVDYADRVHWRDVLADAAKLAEQVKALAAKVAG